MEILNKIQENLLREFSRVPGNSEFYFTGGTALAFFYLKHRQSKDLDFFTSSEGIITDFSNRLEKNLLEEHFTVERRRGLHSFVEFFIGDGTQSTIIQLAQDSAFRFEPTRKFPEYPNLRVDNLTDIASNKLLALFGRATLRDFIDVYTLIKGNYFRAEELVEKAQKKDPGFDLYWLGIALEQIQNFTDGDQDLMMLLEPIPFEELSAFFRQWRETISQKLKP